MQSAMKNQRSSPARPLAFTSARQALSLGLLALHLAFMSFSFCAVSFIFDGLASVGAAVDWAEAVCRLPATSSAAARQTVMRSIGIPFEVRFLIFEEKANAAGRMSRGAGSAIRISWRR